MSYYLNSFCSKTELSGLNEAHAINHSRPTSPLKHLAHPARTTLHGMFDSKVTVKMPKDLKAAVDSLPQFQAEFGQATTEAQSLDNTVKVVSIAGILVLGIAGAIWFFTRK